MRTQRRLVLIGIIGIGLGIPQTGLAWGFWAHRHITRLALYALPPELAAILKPHSAYLTKQCVVPDSRRYVAKAEAPRHYIDLDVYGRSPFDMLPRRWEAALATYGADSLHRHGILPWHVALRQRELTEAFRARDGNLVLYHAAELSHYLADANVPLHTTRNYDGQLTGQRGIHALWESQLPRQLGEQFNFYVGKVQPLDDFPAAVWEAVFRAHACLNVTLVQEARLRATTSPDQRQGLKPDGKTLRKSFSRDYVRRYHVLLEGQVEQQMRASVHLVASAWVTAWVEAGQPRMDQMRWGTPPEPEAYDHNKRLLQLQNDPEADTDAD